MKYDLIVDEVRAARDTIARRHDDDVDAICEVLPGSSAAGSRK